MAQEYVLTDTYLDKDGQEVEIRIAENLTCPAGHQEVENPNDPVDNWVWNIRAYRVHTGGTWWSECRRCKEAGSEHYWFNEDGLWG